MRQLLQSGNRRVTAGDLTAKIVVEREIRTADGYAGATRDWQQVATAWALVEPIYVAEREQRGAVRDVVQYRFTVYRRRDIDATMRIVWDGTTHNIKGIRLGPPAEVFMDIITETGLGD